MTPVARRRSRDIDTVTGNVVSISGTRYVNFNRDPTSTEPGDWHAGDQWNNNTTGRLWLYTTKWVQVSPIMLPLATGQSTASAGATVYIAFGASSAEANMSMPVPMAFTATRLYASVGTAPGVGQSFTYTLRKNGADTTITFSIGGASTTGNDTAHTVAFLAGDLVDVKLVGSAGAAAAFHTLVLS